MKAARPLSKEKLKLALYETQLIATLPNLLRTLWVALRADKLAPLAAAPRPTQCESPKPPRPGAFWHPATAVMRLWSVVVFIEAARRLGIAGWADLEPLLEPVTTTRILNSLSHYSAVTRARILTDLRIVAKRLLHRDEAWLAIGARRLRSEAPRKVDDGRLKSRAEYMAAALKMRPDRPIGRPYSPREAVALRHAAIVGMMADISPRRAEAAELLLAEVLIDRGHVTILIPSEISKTGFGQVRQLEPEMAALMEEYILHGRPVLANLPTADGSGSLWLSDEGRSMLNGSATQSLARPLEKVIGATASANLFRDAQIDRPDVRDIEKPRTLGHRGGSRTSDQNYGSRRHADGLAAMWQLLADEDNELAQYD